MKTKLGTIHYVSMFLACGTTMDILDSLNLVTIKARGHPFSSGGRACDLCLTEKLTILTADQNSMLNKRDELLETCRHRRKHLLVSLFKPPEEDEPPDTTIK